MTDEQIVEMRIEWKRILREAITNVVQAALDSHPSRGLDHHAGLAARIDLGSVLCDHFGRPNVGDELVADRDWTDPVD